MNSLIAWRAPATFALALSILVLAACGTADPVARAVEQRARWKVQLLGWAQTEDGTFNLSTRLSGPTSTSLEQLTVRVQFYDAEERQIGASWYTFDLADAPRGGPADLNVSVPDPGGDVHGVYIDPVADPTEEERAHLVELPR